MPAHLIDRDQERTQLYVGKMPGQFDVDGPEGSSLYQLPSLTVGHFFPQCLEHIPLKLLAAERSGKQCPLLPILG